MAPRLKFRGQPFRDEDTAAAFLEKGLGDPAVSQATLVAAWVRFGGLSRLRHILEEFRARGGHLRIVLGIDEGGASRPGLTLASRLADQAFVFHDQAARTFHPKLFLLEGPEKAIVWVGSSNVTAGGLFSNYEAALEVEFSLPDEAEAEPLAEARRYVEQLLGDDARCRVLDATLLASLVENPRYRISPGERRRGQPPVDSPAAEELFGQSQLDLVRTPGLTKSAREELRELEGPEAQSADPPGGMPSVVRSWSKILPRSDAQQPTSAKTNPTGNLRLTSGVEKVDWRSWFREDLFGEESWSTRTDSNDNPVEVTTVPLDITIEGEPLGRKELTVDHAVHRESGQANHMTILHWGPLMPALLAADYSNYTITIERLSDDTYRLDISP